MEDELYNKMLYLIKTLVDKLPNERRDYSGVEWCASCGAVLWVIGDPSPPNPCRPNCILQEAKEFLSKNRKK